MGKRIKRHTEKSLMILTTDMENSYRRKTFPSEKTLMDVKHRLCCTACGRNLMNEFKTGGIYTHPSLEVILCRQCHAFYGDGNFERDKKSGDDIYCRWCAQGGTIYCCSKCSVAFCKKCIDRNFKFDKKVMSDIEKDDWACFICHAKPMWYLRALSWAVNKYKKGEVTTPNNRKRKLSNSSSTDSITEIKRVIKPGPASSKKAGPASKKLKLEESEVKKKPGPASKTIKSKKDDHEDEEEEEAFATRQTRHKNIDFTSKISFPPSPISKETKPKRKPPPKRATYNTKKSAVRPKRNAPQRKRKAATYTESTDEDEDMKVVGSTDDESADENDAQLEKEIQEPLERHLKNTVDFLYKLSDKFNNKLMKYGVYYNHFNTSDKVNHLCNSLHKDVVRLTQLFTTIDKKMMGVLNDFNEYEARIQREKEEQERAEQEEKERIEREAREEEERIEREAREEEERLERERTEEIERLEREEQEQKKKEEQERLALKEKERLEREEQEKQTLEREEKLKKELAEDVSGGIVLENYGITEQDVEEANRPPPPPPEPEPEPIVETSEVDNEVKNDQEIIESSEGVIPQENTETLPIGNETSSTDISSTNLDKPVDKVDESQQGNEKYIAEINVGGQNEIKISESSNPVNDGHVTAENTESKIVENVEKIENSETLKNNENTQSNSHLDENKPMETNNISNPTNETNKNDKINENNQMEIEASEVNSTEGNKMDVDTEAKAQEVVSETVFENDESRKTNESIDLEENVAKVEEVLDNGNNKPLDEKINGDENKQNGREPVYENLNEKSEEKIKGAVQDDIDGLSDISDKTDPFTDNINEKNAENTPASNGHQTGNTFVQ